MQRKLSKRGATWNDNKKTDISSFLGLARRHCVGFDVSSLNWYQGCQKTVSFCQKKDEVNHEWCELTQIKGKKNMLNPRTPIAPPQCAYGFVVYSFHYTLLLVLVISSNFVWFSKIRQWLIIFFPSKQLVARTEIVRFSKITWWLIIFSLKTTSS